VYPSQYVYSKRVDEEYTDPIAIEEDQDRVNKCSKSDNGEVWSAGNESKVDNGEVWSASKESKVDDGSAWTAGMR
jgi:hypothetical protein